MSRFSLTQQAFVVTLALLPFAQTLDLPQSAAAERPAAASIDIAPEDWPWWRGPTRDGVAFASQTPPVAWSETENVLWKIPVPGRGHGSPTVVGGHVLLAAAKEKAQVQSVVCYDRNTGKELWNTAVHRGKFAMGLNKRASHASSSVACDGKRLFINFVNSDAVYTTALDREGKQLWQTKISAYKVHQGYGSSPAIYGPLVIVTADNKLGGAVAALDRESGKIVWKNDRPKTPNYPSPVVLKVAGRDQVLLTGCNLVTGFDALTGKKLWESKGSTTECVTSTVTDGELIFTSGGYPKNHLSAVRAGTGEIVWEQNVRIYVPSMLFYDGHLYSVTDAGVAICWKAATGEEVWKARLGGTFNASPVRVGENVYATNQEGTTFIFKATAAKYVPVAENSLGEDVFATPAICGGRLYARVAKRKNGDRQEWLYAVGNPSAASAGR